MKKKAASLALALVMALGLLSSPALAFDWNGAEIVNTYEEFTAALKNDAVTKISVDADITIPAGTTVTASKPIVISGSDQATGSIKLEQGAVLISDVPQGQYWYEDAEHTFDLLARDCEAFLLWAGDSGTYRKLYGTQVDALKDLYSTEHGALNTVMFSGADVKLEKSLSAAAFWVMGGRSLTLGEDVVLTVSGGYVDGDLTLEKGAKRPEGLECGGTVTVSNPFTDVAETSPYYPGILWAVANEVTTGYTDGTFRPANPCTRAQIITFLWRAAGSPEPKVAEPSYEDVTDTSAYYYKAVQWSAEMGMVDGVTFAPNDPCTRAAAVYFIWRANGSDDAANTSFTDVAGDADYIGAVNWAVANGVTLGTTDTTFSPSTTCTRGQIATFLYRAAQAAEKAEG